MGDVKVRKNAFPIVVLHSYSTCYGWRSSDVHGYNEIQSHRLVRKGKAQQIMKLRFGMAQLGLLNYFTGPISKKHARHLFFK